MTHYVEIILVSLKNRLLEESRYPFQFFFNSVSFILFAYLVGLGGTAIQGSKNVEVGVASFFLAFLAGAALNQPLDLLNSSNLEDFYLRPMNSLLIHLFTAIGRGIELFLTLSIFMLAFSLIKHTDLIFSLRIALVGLPVFLGTLGIGLFIASIRLIFSKIGAFPQLIWFALLGLAISVNDNALGKIASVSVFSSGLFFVRTGILNIPIFIILVIISILMGLFSYTYAEKIMFKRGLISLD
jgi:hypothetical protein